MRRLVLVTTAVATLLGVGGWAAAASGSGAVPAGSVARYRPGQPVTISVPVANSGAAPCAVSAVPGGALAFTQVTRDSTAVLPQTVPAFYDDGPPAGPDASRTVEAGATTDESATSEPAAGGSAQVFRTVTWSSQTRSMAAAWPIDTPGSYTVTAVVQPPAELAAGTTACAEAVAPVTLRFVVGGAHHTGILWWQIAVAAAVLLVLTVVLLLLWRHRRGRTAAAVLLVLLAGTALPQLAPTKAAAIINFPAGGGDSQAQFDTCMTNFGKMGGDVMSTLTGLGYTVTIKPTLRNSTPVINRADINTDDRSATVVWSWWSKAPLRGGGVLRDPCAQLWHELNHVYDAATGQLDTSWCDDTGITTADVRAVFAESQYRLKFLGKDKVRNDYDGHPMPKSTDACKTPPKQNWGPPPADLNDDCVSDCATTNGDPHIGPFDNHMYDFQAAGEFDALVSGDDSMRVQVRQQPLPGSDSVAVNTAIAMRIGADRVQVAQAGDATSFAVSVNGVPSTGDGPPGGTTLPGGGRLTRWTDRGLAYVLAQWPDGTRVRVRSVGIWGLAFDIALNPARRGRVAGLLGTDRSVPGTPVTTRDGKPFTDLTAPALYQVFGESWRITQADSLFTYAAGQSTATFTDRSFPRHPITTADLTNRAATERLCRAMGLTRSDIVDACVLDLALTGQASFADSALATQNTVGTAAGTSTGGGTTSPPTTVQPGGTLHDGDTVQTAISAPGQTHVYRLDLGDATVFRLADVTGDSDADLRIRLDGPDPGDSPGFTVTSNYQYRVQKGGSYTLTVSREDGKTGAYGFRVVTAKEKRVPLALGEQVTGSLDVPGRIILYTFTANSAARLVIADDKSGCDLSVAVVEDSPAPQVYSPAGLCYGIPIATLEPGKNYLLIVWSGDSKTGDYTFTPTAAPGV